MENLVIVLVLAIVGIFILGVISAFSLLGKLLGLIFAPPPRPATAAYKPPVVPPAPAAPPRRSVTAEMPRVDFLFALERETNKGYFSGQISSTARMELLRYVQQQRFILGAQIAREAEAQARPEPQGKPDTKYGLTLPELHVAEEHPLPLALKNEEREKSSEERALAAPTPHSSLPTSDSTLLTPPVAPPAPKSAAPEVEAKPMRSPEEIRVAIAKLHTDAQAPIVPEQPAVSVQAGPGHSPQRAQSAQRTEKNGMREKPGPVVHSVSSVPSVVSVPAKSFFERLATPENVRILQSLAICVIFISAVALVRTRMWSQASAWVQMGLLLSGTAACVGLGFVLRRWTQLRIAGLAFLILGQLSLLLDTYNALIAPSGAKLYPYCQSSLWTFCFLIFGGLAYWQAKALQEPLFEAFAFFGGLAAWASAALWSGIDEWLLPAAFVPAALLCAQLARWARPAVVVQVQGEAGKMPAPQEQAGKMPALQTAPRWSLPWWLDVGWSMGGGLLSVAVPVAAFISGRENLSEHYWPHALAIFALAAGLFVQAWRTGRVASAQAAAVLCLTLAPLAAYAQAWPWEKWPLMFALPGTFLVFAGLLCARQSRVLGTQTLRSSGDLEIAPSGELKAAANGYFARSPDHPMARSQVALGEQLAFWGLGSVSLGVVWAFCTQFYAPAPSFSAWAAGAGLASAAAFTFLRRSAWGPWAGTLCAAFLAVLCLDASGISREWWPVVWFTFALAAHAAWTFAGKGDDIPDQGRGAADVLSLGATVHLIYLTLILWLPAGKVMELNLVCGWGAAAAYALATSGWLRVAWRRGLGVALLSPALACALYHAGLRFEDPARWLAWLALAIVAVASLVDKREKSAALFHAAFCGATVVVLHGVCLALLQWHLAEKLGAAQAFAWLALAAAVMTIRLRMCWAGAREQVLSSREVLAAGETAALLLLALAGRCFSEHLSQAMPCEPFAAELIAAMIIAAALLAGVAAAFLTRWAAGSTGDVLLDQRPFCSAGAIVALLTTALAALEMLLPKELSAQTGVSDGITCAWGASLVPLFISLWHNFGKSPTARNANSPTLLAVNGALMAGALVVLAACRALREEFWLAACPADVREACAVFFAAAAGVSLLCGLGLRCVFAPLAGILGLLGLAGCAYGAWLLPPESFGLCCGALAWLAYSLGERARQAAAWARTEISTSCYVTGAIVGLIGAGFLLKGLAQWSGGPAQSWAVAAGLLLVAGAWMASAKAGDSSEPGLAGCLAAAAGLCLILAACHAMRWLRLAYDQFGPGFAATALLLLALREVAARSAPSASGEAQQDQTSDGRLAIANAWKCRLGGLMAAVGVGAVLGLCFAGLEASTHHFGSTSLTLAETALLVIALTIVARRSELAADPRLLAASETAALLLLALAGLCVSRQFSREMPFEPFTAAAIAALVILAALVAGRTAVSCLRGTAAARFLGDLPGERPFDAAGAIVALLMTGLAALEMLFPMEFSARAGVGDGIRCAWGASLVPLFICVRHNFGKSPVEKDVSAAAALAVIGAFMAGALAVLAACRAIQAEFWLPACHVDVREACALFFAAAIAVSLLCGLGLKRAFAPVVGILGLLGLAGCAYGAWALRPESFGVCCALLAWLACGLGEKTRKTAPHPPLSPGGRGWGEGAQTRIAASSFTIGALTAIFGGIYLLWGLSQWSGGHAQSWAVAAWLMLAAWAWVASASAVEVVQAVSLRPTGWTAGATGSPLAAGLAALAGLGLAAAACHAMRWTNLGYEQFGPGLAATALMLLALREVAAWFAHSEGDQEQEGEISTAPETVSPGWQLRLRGVLAAIALTGFAGLCFGLAASLHDQAWPACLTLAETALLFVGLTVVARRSGQNLGWRVFLLEMGVWVLLAHAIQLATSRGALEFPLPPAGWMLVAALFILAGMALESIVSALAPPSPNPLPRRGGGEGEGAGEWPVPFLASRHVAACALAALALLAALLSGDAFSKEGLHSTWRALISAAGLALYGSLARCCTSEALAQSVRKCSAFMAYVVLLPAGYFCLLGAHSTGSSWGALYFLALVPVLFAAAYTLEHQKLAAQSSQALLGAGLVNLGALALAFIGNRERLAGVPCATFLALGMELILLRLWRPYEGRSGDRAIGRSNNLQLPSLDPMARSPDHPMGVGSRVYSLGACLALIGAAFYALRAIAGWHAWGDPAPWAWQMPWLATLGLALTVLGGVLKLEAAPAGRARSLIATCGAWLAVVALCFALVHLFYHGMRAPYVNLSNTDYFDALVVSIVLCSATGLAAGRWLGFEQARYFTHAGVLAAYALCVWKQHPESWEWYSLPVALYLFVWAWQSAGESQPSAAQMEARGQEVNALLALASALALLPSFVQAVPQTTSGAWHFLILAGLSLAVLTGAMFARRKVPLLGGAGALILATLLKAVQWAHQKEVIWPVAGIAFGLVVLAVAMLFEQRMNQAFRKAVDKARAEARMFWVSWE